MSHFNKTEQDDWMTVYLKYLLFVFNFFFWLHVETPHEIKDPLHQTLYSVFLEKLTIKMDKTRMGEETEVGGAAVMAVGIWTLVEKSDYLNILASSTFAVSACILIFAGGLVMITGFLGFCAIIREQRSCLSAYFSMLLLIFLIELVAGVLAYVYYQRLSQVLKQHLTRTLTENYALPGKTHITHSVDRLQQEFKCCGSNSSDDWQHSIYILSVESSGRVVPDSCCKTVTFKCGKRDHPSNIYKVEGGCVTKLEQFLADHLLIMGAVGIGVACLQEKRSVTQTGKMRAVG
ncbi:tetraspanin-11 isoform X4 [Caretta caretta]|uniref:tetraspanin-11 isoform X4 n=1 Tax=Caretta caretta TaxID=8467 RepID=UPI003F4B6279